MDSNSRTIFFVLLPAPKYEQRKHKSDNPTTAQKVKTNQKYISDVFALAIVVPLRVDLLAFK